MFPELTPEDIEMFADIARTRKEEEATRAAEEAVANLRRWTGRLGPKHKQWST